LYCYSSYSTPRDLHSFPTRRSSDLTAWAIWVALAAALESNAATLSGTDTLGRGGTTQTRADAEVGLPDPEGGRATRAEFTAQERSEEHTSELQSRSDLVCRLLLEKK